MALDKIYRMYPTFEAWVRSHKHSSVSVECALRDALNGSGQPHRVPEVIHLQPDELRSEIKGEISEARYWIRYFRKQKR